MTLYLLFCPPPAAESHRLAAPSWGNLWRSATHHREQKRGVANSLNLLFNTAIISASCLFLCVSRVMLDRKSLKKTWYIFKIKSLFNLFQIKHSDVQTWSSFKHIFQTYAGDASVHGVGVVDGDWWGHRSGRRLFHWLRGRSDCHTVMWLHLSITSIHPFIHLLLLLL